MAPRLRPLSDKSAIARPLGTREALKASVEKFGLVFPVLMTPDGICVDGRMRIEVCVELGVEYKTQLWEVGGELTMAHIIAEVANAQNDVDWTEQVQYLASQGYDRPIIAAALGIKNETVEGILADPAVEEPEEVPVSYIEHHEVLGYIPELTLEEYEALKTDIRDNGMREPVLVSPDGLLVDGRARWNIAHELGFTPTTRRCRGNQWEQSLLANGPRLHDEKVRLLIAARLPGRMGGTVANDQRPPAREFTCEALKVPYGTVKPLRQVVTAENAGEPLVQAWLDDRIKPGTARRIAVNVPPRDWEKAIRRVERAALIGVKPQLPEFPGEIAKRDARGPITSVQDRDRNRFVTGVHIRQAIDNLIALDTVVNGTSELEPGIDSDQAADLLRNLTTNRRAITRLVALLKERKEATSA